MPPAPANPPTIAAPRGAMLAWALLTLLLVTNVPLFLCMPLTDDAAMYDLQARCLLRGGVLYRDILEPNLPGVVWIHTAVRGVFGTSSLALRAVDLFFFSCVVVLVWCWLRSASASPRVLAWTVLVLFFCYLSMSEWCHCQRDVWLLLPGLGALTLRRRQLDAWRAGSRRPLWSIAWWGAVEGLCWGVGVWLKPMIVVPAACCWLVSAIGLRSWRAVAADLAGLVTGGLVIGGAGIAWLHASGAWPYFVTTLVEWNPLYFRAGREHWTALRYASMLYRFFPWQFIHLAAVPVAAALGSRRVQESKSEKVEKSKSGKVEEWKSEKVEEPESRPDASPHFFTFPPFRFSTSASPVFYLAWLAQSYFLQHLFDYVHAPGVLLAVAVLAAGACGRVRRGGAASESGEGAGQPLPPDGSVAVTAAASSRGVGQIAWRFAVAGFLALALFASPVVRSDRLSCWWACVTRGSTAEVRDRLRVLQLPHWQDLERVADYLRTQRLQDGELTCYSSSLIHLYERVGLGPSTRYAYFETYAVLFADRHRQLLDALASSRQRYVASDLIASGMSTASIQRLCPEGPLDRPPQFPPEFRTIFPWSQPVVFRAGPYLIHRVARPLGRLARRPDGTAPVLPEPVSAAEKP